MRSRCASSSFCSLLELGEPLGELGLDAGDRLLQALLVGRVVRRGEQREGVELLDHLAGERVDRAHALDLVAEELDADRALLVGGEDLDGVAAHAELVAGEREVVALVLQLDEPAQDRPLVALLADARASAAASRTSRVSRARRSRRPTPR